MARLKKSPVEDLAQFMELAKRLADFRSLRKVAQSCGTPLHTLLESLERLENHFRMKLLDRDNAKLTIEGANLLEKFHLFLYPAPSSKNNTPRVRLTHSLLHNRLLISLINRFNQQKSEDQESVTPIELTIGREFEDTREIESLLSGEIDLLLCWGLPGRIQRWEGASGITIRVFDFQYQLALISHSENIARKCVSEFNNSDGSNESKFCLNINETVNYRGAFLEHNSQPHDDYMTVEGMHFMRNRRVTASSFHEIIELVRTRFADYGIVPIVGTYLDQLSYAGEVFYTPLKSNGIDYCFVQIVAFHRLPINRGKSSKLMDEINSRTAVVKRLVDFLDDKMGEGTKSLVKEFTLATLPENPEEFSTLKYGYYLYRPEVDSEASEDTAVPRWHEEDIIGLKLVKSDNSVTLDKNVSSPLIINTRKQVYEVKEARLEDGAFMLVAREKKLKPDQSHQCGFISVFNCKVQEKSRDSQQSSDFPELVIAGLWNGGGGLKSASTWSTIYSSGPIPKEVLNEIARCAIVSFTLLEPPQYPTTT